MKIEIVSHCYRYASLLRYQLSSLVLLPPPSGVEITATVFHTPSDEATCAVLEWFLGQNVPGVCWNWQSLPVPELCRRSIGRNQAALATQADWVWFTDADYWFTTACWSALSRLGIQEGPLLYPRRVMTHIEHVLGDRAILQARQQSGGLLSTEESEYAARRMKRAIGGIQIVRGAVCREKGYLPDHSRAQAPAREAAFERCREDVWFRKSLGTSGRSVDLPGVYRIRHSQNGRSVPGLEL